MGGRVGGWVGCKTPCCLTKPLKHLISDTGGFCGVVCWVGGDMQVWGGGVRDPGMEGWRADRVLGAGGGGTPLQYAAGHTDMRPGCEDIITGGAVPVPTTTHHLCTPPPSAPHQQCARLDLLQCQWGVESTKSAWHTDKLSHLHRLWLHSSQLMCALVVTETPSAAAAAAAAATAAAAAAPLPLIKHLRCPEGQLRSASVSLGAS